LKVSISGGTGFSSVYTNATLMELCRRAGVAVVDEADADSLWVSLCDPDDLPVLQAAKRVAKGRPVIMGGFEGYFGEPYLAWANAVVVGEGWEFIRAWAKSPDEAMELPSVLSNNGRDVFPSYDVPWRYHPLVRNPGGNRYYYLAGRGCKGKCRFCATAWTQPNSGPPSSLLHSVVSSVEQKRGKLTLITNDSDLVVMSKCVNAQSVRVVDYNREPSRYKGTILHFGIEGWRESDRVGFSKPIPNGAIRELLAKTKAHKQQCELFFLVGYEGWTIESVEEFAETLDCDAGNSPKIWVKCTYFDPCPHTPLSKVAVDPRYCDIPTVFNILNCGKSKRIRVFPTRSAARSAWRTVLHRSTPAEALLLGKQPSGTNKLGEFDLFTERLRQLGLAQLLEEQSSEPCARIKCSPRLIHREEKVA
jgi:hypothetical protein